MASQESVAVVQKKLSRLAVEGKVPLGAAQRLIRDSAYWHGHPQGPTRAPDHSRRIVHGRFGWEVEFGANYFLVGRAIARSVYWVGRYIALARPGGPRPLLSDIGEELRLEVIRSVANSNHELYGNYPEQDGYLLFGTQAIHVPSFVNKILAFTEVRRICSG